MCSLLNSFESLEMKLINNELEIFKKLEGQAKHKSNTPSLNFEIDEDIFQSLGALNETEKTKKLISYFILNEKFDNSIKDMKTHSSKAIKFKNEWLSILTDDIPKYLNGTREQNLLELLIFLKALNIFHNLADKTINVSVTETEQKDIILSIFTYRLFCFNLIYNVCKRNNEYIDYQNNVRKAYQDEFKKFVEFITSKSFQGYLLQEDLKIFCSRLLSKRKDNIEVDAVIDLTITKFIKVVKEGNQNSTEVKNYITKIINNFHLPRYNILYTLKYFRFLKLFPEIINFFTPRLIASIIIGLVPFVLTGEIYEWYAIEIIKKNVSKIPIILMIVGCHILISIYLYIEIKNYLGYANKTTLNRWIFINIWGVLWSLLLTLGTTHFSNYYLSKELGEITQGTLLGIYSLDLFLLQASLSLLFGVILQMIWEDKPITQPL